MNKSNLQSNNKKKKKNHSEISLESRSLIISLLLRQNWFPCFSLLPIFWGVHDYLLPIWNIEYYANLQYWQWFMLLPSLHEQTQELNTFLCETIRWTLFTLFLFSCKCSEIRRWKFSTKRSSMKSFYLK